MRTEIKAALSRFMADYGMLFVLIVLCIFLSAVTYDEQQPSGASAAEQLAAAVIEELGGAGRVMVVASPSPEDVEFADIYKRWREA